MHEVIQHVGIASCLNAWQIEVQKRNPTITSLDDFAVTNPSWEDLQMITNEISQKYILSGDIATLRINSKTDHDQQNENILLWVLYFSLYKEMLHDLNHRDFSCVESLFFPWMYIFHGCGKHKYANKMQRYLENMHFVYTPELRYIFLLNWFRMSDSL